MVLRIVSGEEASQCGSRLTCHALSQGLNASPDLARFLLTFLPGSLAVALEPAALGEVIEGTSKRKGFKRPGQGFGPERVGESNRITT